MHRNRHGVSLAAIRDDGRQLSLHWPTTARPAEVRTQLLQLAGFAGSAEVMVWQADLLADISSGPGLAEAAQSLLQRTRELLAVALLVRPGESDYSPETFALSLGVPWGAAGDALARAQLCRTLAEALRHEMLSLPAPVLSVLRGLLLGNEALAWLDLESVALSPLGSSALDLIVNTRPPVPKRLPRRAEELPAPLEELVCQLLGEEGPVAAALDNYEHRPGQIEMARAVARALEDDGLLMVEAATGVGKSLAYLVPSILFSRARAEPVVVSTNTKNLQEQLMHKDLPLLAHALPVDFEAVLLKGRANYVCPRRFMNVVREAQGSLFGADQIAAAYLVCWMAASDSGDLDGIPAEARAVFPQLGSMVERVRSERGSCLGPNCPQAGVCPMRRARALSQNADIIISNHALTLADVSGDVLPNYARIIFDEAHNLEDVATEQLGSEVSNFSLRDLQRIFVGDGRAQGLTAALSLVAAATEKLAGLGPLAELIASRIAMMQEVGLELGEAVIALCTALAPEPNSGRASVRLDSHSRMAPPWQAVVRAATRCRLLLQETAQMLGQAAELVQQAGPEAADAADLMLEACAARTWVMELEAALGAVLTEEDEEEPQFVCWAEARWRGRSSLWRLCAAPIEVGPALQRAVYERRATVVMTSATLTVEDSFEYMSHRLGLRREPRLRTTTVSSPFDLPAQLLLCVPQDLPFAGDRDHREAVAEALVRIVELSGGGTLVLFTSRVEMEAVFGAVAARLSQAGLQPLCQHLSGPRSSLLTRMRAADDVVLFGLKSFWEGVDVPGEALRCVVMVKLPFAVPTDPIVVARCEQVARDGLDSMNDYYIPEAVIGFKQGIGRLIRTTTDRGVVFVLDSRLLARSYSHRFLNSIPRCAVSFGSFDECLEEAGRWFAQISPEENHERTHSA